jgi:hypothetical protein
MHPRFRSQCVRASLVGAPGIEIAGGVDQHVGRQLRRLSDENAATAFAGRTEVIRRILVFGGLGSAGVPTLPMSRVSASFISPARLPPPWACLRIAMSADGGWRPRGQ